MRKFRYFKTAHETSLIHSIYRRPNYYPGLWTIFAMLGASVLITIYLRFTLGGSSEYRETIVMHDRSAMENTELPTTLVGEDDDDDKKKAAESGRVTVLTREAV